MTHSIGMFVFDGLTLLDASGPADVFHHADPTGKHYHVQLMSPAGGAVTSSSGVTLANTIRAAEAHPPDTLLMTGGPSLVQREHDSALLSAVETLADGAQRVASVCTGAFVLAALGHLDDRRATTHWRHSRTLAQWYPRIHVEPDVLHTQDGRYLTSAGVTAGIDLALAIVEHDLGVDVAREVARELVMFMQRPGGQSQFSSALSGPPATNDQLRTMMETVIADPAAEHTVVSMAEMIGVSTRHLNRIFHAEVGNSPAQWLEQVRVDAARGLILEGHSITRVAQLCGLGTDETLRRAFAKHLGTTPSAFRHRFASTSM
ncbi:GlxA family transcriptional regulator [Enteractinococcus helveticum]|uniref:AraC family transcriptional regulator n=1 Tax=Enteractinococcus helveticum TaxID=1837282 RepID=A0A1B7LY03_9MICC|nr:DJ-1/PfpI family protein [Enteractinococcus helveticum]OAV60153.1 AraC family transcriptional regulator [Enteractinococcus helveticum]